MGLYDTVWFNCPKCKNLVGVQNKAGECILKDIDCGATPVAISKDIVYDSAWCGECGVSYTIVPDEPLPNSTRRLKLE